MRVTGGGGGGGRVPLFDIFVHSRSRFLKFLSAQSPSFTFLSILGDNMFICPLWSH